jgi:hypothetical protein
MATLFARDVGLGSKAALPALKCDFRFTSVNGHHRVDPACPFRAISGLAHRSKLSSISRNRLLLACLRRDYSFSIRRDLTFFSPIFCFGAAGVSDEYSLSNGLG